MPDFDRITLIASREWWTRLRQRSFQVTTIVQILFVIAAGCLPVLIAGLSGDDEPAHETILVRDEANANATERLAPYLMAVPEDGADAGSDVITLQATDIAADELRNQVDAGNVDGALVVTRDDGGTLAFSFINQSGDTTTTAQRIYAAAASVSLEDRLARSGIDEAAFQEATAPPTFTVAGTDAAGEDDNGVNGVEVALAYFFTIVMFMAIMLYGNWVAQGVVEEKSSRIMEIMVNAATPRDLLAGKVVGIGAAGLTQLVPMLLAGGIVFALQKPIARALDIDTSSLPDLDFGAVSISAVGWFLVYFLLGFTLYAAMYAALGSLVSRQEEVNQAVSPMMTVMMVGYLSAFFTMWSPDTLFSRILTIFPLTSPFVMISRVIVGDPPAWEMVLSVGLLAATMVLAILFAARVYRVGILQYGQKPSWKALFGRTLTATSR